MGGILQQRQSSSDSEKNRGNNKEGGKELTRQEFIDLAKSWGYGYSDEDIADILSQLSDEELFPGAGVSVREDTFRMDGVSTEEEWLDYYAKNWLMHY